MRKNIMIYKYKYKYQTPKGFSDIFMTSDGKALTKLCFDCSRNILNHEKNYIENELPIFKKTSKWLDIYFSGKNPDFTPEYKIDNLTPFRKEVIEILKSIPFGVTLTYKDISMSIAKNRKIEKMSNQAVGGAVGWNPICIIIPCHRVVGTNGNLTGYSGGIQNKMALLALEKMI